MGQSGGPSDAEKEKQEHSPASPVNVLKEKKAPFIYRMCSVLEHNDIKRLVSFVLVGSMCAYGGHKLTQYMKSDDLKTALSIAQQANDKNGYVTFSSNGKNISSDGSRYSSDNQVLLEPEVKKLSLKEAKAEITSNVNKAYQLTNYVGPVGLGLIGGLVGAVLLGNLIEMGDEAKRNWEHNQWLKKSAYTSC